jgi:hypothetical protein
MEPVDPRMGGLLGGGDAGGGGGPDELRAIVTKAGRTMRLRAAAVAGVVAVAAGGGVGYAVSATGGSSKQVVATSPLAGRSPSSSGESGAPAAPGASSSQSEGAPSIALPAPARFTRLFVRQANGVSIRGYLIASPLMSPLAGNGTAYCGTLGSRLQAEVSTTDMVGVVGSGFVAQRPGSAILDAEPSVAGEAEGDPVAVVVVQTGSAVAKVRMDFTGGGSDQMAPVQGWSALAAPAPGFKAGSVAQVTLGTLTALDSSGRTVATQTVTWPPGPVPAAGGVSAGSGSGTASSGAIAYPCRVTPPTTTPCEPPSACGPAPLPATTGPANGSRG